MHAQTLKVSVDKNPAIVGEQILIQYSIDADAENFKSPNFNGIQVLSGPNPSSQSSITIINGKRESSKTTTYSFYLRAIQKGTYNISPAKVTANGKSINSQTLTLNVVEAKEKDKLQQQKLTDNLFIKVDVSKRNIVIGEQILVTYKLLTRLDLQNTEISSLPNLNGFWTKDLETSSRFKRDVINGVAYNVATIKKTVLTAQKAGKLIIDPMELKCSIRIQTKRNNRDPFASFFGGSYNIQEELITSKPIIINVNKLPSPPANFKGAVGNMSIKSEVDNTIVNANDAITYKISITGTGNIELIEPLDIQFPEDFEVYDPKKLDRIFEGGRKRSIRTFEYLLIPRYKGNYTIPNAKLIVYNNQTKQYETKQSNRHQLTINENTNSEDESIIPTQQIIQNDKKDINYIYSQGNLRKIGEKAITMKLFYVLFFLPILLIIVLWIYSILFRKTNTSSYNWKNKKANKIALKRLKNAQTCINNNNFDLFFAEIEKSLWGYFADKFKVNIADLSKETINNYFDDKTLSNEIKLEFIELLDLCEFARYAPADNKNTQMGGILTKAKNIIIKVETALK